MSSLARQHDHFSDRQLCDTASIAERCIKDRYSAEPRLIKVNLIGSNTKTAYSQQLFCVIKNSFCYTGL
jgi:hypothetical protein